MPKKKNEKKPKTKKTPKNKLNNEMEIKQAQVLNSVKTKFVYPVHHGRVYNNDSGS